MKKTAEEWVEVFKNYDTCVMPVKNFEEACEDPQIIARKMVIDTDHPKLGKIKNVASPIKLSRTPLEIRNVAPKVGEHTKEVLGSLGYTADEIREFRKKKLI